MLELATNWRIEIDRSPEWLFFRIESAGLDELKHPLSRTFWATATESSINRIVVELADGVLLSSYLIGQLIVLHKRAHLDGGIVRLCGLSEHNCEALEMMRLDDRFPNYASREAAVMGHYPNKPR
jgi:anti-anti-sigma regulatory factor